MSAAPRIGRKEQPGYPRAVQRQRTPKGAASRRRLLDAAAAELVAEGGSCELARVAARAGVSITLPYRYFGSKGGMVAAVVADFFDRFEACFAFPAKPNVPWAARQRTRLNQVVDFLYGEPLATIFFSVLLGEPEVVALHAARMQRLVAYAAAGVRKGKDAGFVPESTDEMIAASMLIGGIRQVIISALTSEPPIPRARVKRELWGAISRLLDVPAKAARDA